jgi:trigger factor
VAILKAEEESPTLTVLEIEVPAEESEEARRGVTRAYAKQAALPGFRKGHAPESVVQKRFTEQIREDVLERVIPEALSTAIEERKLSVLGHPRIEALTWDPPGPIRFTARLEKKPPVDPGEYRGIPVEDATVEPSDAEVSQVLDRLR